MGLSITRDLIEQHGGFIQVSSEPGVGTTCKVYLPVVEHPSTHDGSPTLPIAQGGCETILVAEDKTLIRDVVIRMLEGAGYSVLTAADGEQAVRQFSENRDAVDLLLLDVMMPKLDGREVFERARAIDPDVPVVFCTGEDPGADQADCSAREGVHLLYKPFSANDLLVRVREALDRRYELKL